MPPPFLSLAHQIRDLIAANQTGEAFQQLLDALQNHPELDTIILNAARYDQLRTDIRQGVLPQEWQTVEMSRIRNNLLEIVRELEILGRGETKVFIAYQSHEPSSQLALFLHDQLKAKGYVPFLDVKDIPVGAHLPTALKKAISSAHYFILLLSQASLTSQVVLEDLKLARNLRESKGYPVLLPVRVQLPEDTRFHADLNQLLGQIRSLPWQGQGDNSQILADLLDVIGQRATLAVEASEISPENETSDFIGQPDQPPLPVASLRYPRGGEPLDSEFYLQRPGEQVFIEQLTGEENILLIKGPRQYGKTSLLSRVIQHARAAQFQVVSLNFQNLHRATLNSFDQLLWEFCSKISRPFRLRKQFQNDWKQALEAMPNRDRKQLVEEFLEDEVLPILEKEAGYLLIAIDEADRLFTRQQVSNEFFSMLRAWHELRTTDPAWERLKVAITYSTDAQAFITDLDQSPFNVGAMNELVPFEVAHIQQLIQAYRLTAQLPQDATTRLHDLLGGHPFLIRSALYRLAAGQGSFEDLLTQSDQDLGPFKDHLDALYHKLSQRSDLAQAFRSVIRTNQCEDKALLSRLAAIGLVKSGRNGQIHPACELYGSYFRDKF
ncbi:MAG: AAA-like domain-containing protein [Bacteroidota bacterium]